MDNQDASRLKDVGRDSAAALQTAFDAAMSAGSPEPGDATTQASWVTLAKQNAEIEAQGNPVRGDNAGFTAGLRSLVSQISAGPYGRWQAARRPFDTLLQPHRERIEAVKNMAAELARIQADAAAREEAILAEARADVRYVERQEQMDVAVSHFDMLHRQAGQRPITMFGKTWPYLIVLLGITSVEWFINYSFFFDWLDKVPVNAIGFTIAMAGGVAFAAHIHGEFLKQRNSRFGEGCEHIPRNITLVSLAIVALVAGVGISGYARYTSVLANLVQSTTLMPFGQPSSSNHADPLVGVFVSLGINLIVWLIGLFIAFFSHDENENLMEAQLEKWRRTRRFEKVQAPYSRRIKTLRAQTGQEIKGLQARNQAAARETADALQKLEAVDRQEMRHFAALAGWLQPIVNLYQSELGRQLDSLGHKLRIESRELSGTEFRGIPLDLGSSGLKDILSRQGAGE